MTPWNYENLVCPFRRIEATALVRTVTERLIGRMAAATQRNCGFAFVDRVSVAFAIDERDWTFDEKWTVVPHRNLDIRHANNSLVESAGDHEKTAMMIEVYRLEEI